MEHQSLFPRFPAKETKYSSLTNINEHQSHLLQAENQIMEEETQEKKLFAPTAQLSGAQASLYSVKFSPCGNFLATAGQDKLIYLWDIYNNCTNHAVLKGHNNAILDLNYNVDGSFLFSASTDKTVGVWDIESQRKTRKLQHTDFVNSCSVSKRGQELLLTTDDDGIVRIWDLRSKKVAFYYKNKYPLTTSCFNDTSEKIFFGGIENSIKQLDLRKQQVDTILEGHTDTITGISLSGDGGLILSNSMDQTLRIWDIRPFVIGQRCLKILTGHSHSFEKLLLRASWSPNGDYISAGSSDKFLYIWNSQNKQIIQKLDGHMGSINDVAFSPTDRLIASASSDKTVILGTIPDEKYKL